MTKIKFEYEYIESHEKIRNIIKGCEGKHIQQVSYSTYEDAITQVCFTEGKIRSTFKTPAMTCNCETCKKMKEEVKDEV
jgi:hypothetical protein